MALIGAGRAARRPSRRRAAARERPPIAAGLAAEPAAAAGDQAAERGAQGRRHRRRRPTRRRRRSRLRRRPAQDLDDQRRRRLGRRSAARPRQARHAGRARHRTTDAGCRSRCTCTATSSACCTPSTTAGSPISSTPCRCRRTARCRIAFIADNPGKWLIASTVLERFDTGLVDLVRGDLSAPRLELHFSSAAWPERLATRRSGAAPASRDRDAAPTRGFDELALPAPGQLEQLSQHRRHASGKSSAIRPGPKRRPASAWIQTPAQAASNAGIPCAIRPATMPDSTSPEPAVAR